MLEVELLQFDVETLADRRGPEVLPVPEEHLLHVLDHVRDPVFRGAPGRPGEPEGLVPATAPGAEHVDIGYGGKVVPVQVRDEDVVHLVERNPRGQVVGDGARTHVEDEAVAIPQFNVY